MTPILPGALIERERICDDCSCPATDCEDVELSFGGATYCLCCECRDRFYAQIAAVRAEMAAAQAAEDGSSEE